MVHGRVLPTLCVLVSGSPGTDVAKFSHHVALFCSFRLRYFLCCFACYDHVLGAGGRVVAVASCSHFRLHFVILYHKLFLLNDIHTLHGRKKTIACRV
jgi:hypothetical protein